MTSTAQSTPLRPPSERPSPLRKSSQINAAESRRARREQLRDFYGLGGKASSATGTNAVSKEASTERAGDPLDIGTFILRPTHMADTHTQWLGLKALRVDHRHTPMIPMRHLVLIE